MKISQSRINRASLALALLLPGGSAQAVDFDILRSEYLDVGDTVGEFFVDGLGEVFAWEIPSGNEDGHFAVNLGSPADKNEALVLASPIPDVAGSVTEHVLEVRLTGTGGTAEYTLRIRDGFDHLVATWPHTQMLDTNQASARNGSWTAYNNLWGDGSAVPGTDYRWAILVGDDLPAGPLIVWDMPGRASDFGGASVWGYSQLFVGNRTGKVEDNPGFPIRLADLLAADLEFDFELFPGDDRFKIALNLFLTDEPELAPFSANDGDFFFVFDQVGTWVPPVPGSDHLDLGDITIDGHIFARLYDNNAVYERRRVIIRNHGRFLSGKLDLLDLFDQFADLGHLNRQQSIPSFMVGVEVTEGFGAVGFNALDLDLLRVGDATEPKVTELDLEAGEIRAQVPRGRYAWLEHSPDLLSGWDPVAKRHPLCRVCSSMPRTSGHCQSRRSRAQRTANWW